VLPEEILNGSGWQKTCMAVNTCRGIENCDSGKKLEWLRTSAVALKTAAKSNLEREKENWRSRILMKPLNS
jgi:hypothetical protein